MTFSHMIGEFFTAHLAGERQLAENTIKTYGYALELLVDFMCETLEVQPEKLHIDMLTRDVVLDYLDYLKTERKCANSTCCTRLAAIRALCHYGARHDPLWLKANEQVQSIRFGREPPPKPVCLLAEEIDAILGQPDVSTPLGVRDDALLRTLYNTGARASELAALTRDNIRLESCPSVTLTGKGGTVRTVPLWQGTVEAIKRYLDTRPHPLSNSEPLFLNIKGTAITRFGIGRLVAKYAEQAAEQCPSLSEHKITPHVFRHTIALHLVEAGNGLDQVQHWLGHVDMRTTNAYIAIRDERMRKAIEKVPAPISRTVPEQPRWKKPSILDQLRHISRTGVMLRPIPSRCQQQARAPA